MAVRPGGLSLRRFIPAFGIGLALAVASVLSALAVANAARSERSEHLATAGDAEAARIVAIVERAIVEVERLAVGDPSVSDFRRAAVPRTTTIPALRTIALAQLDAGRLVVRSAVPTDIGLLSTGTDLTASDALDVVVGRATIDADAAAGTPFDHGSRRAIAVAAPVFRGLADVTASEASQRSSITGAVIGALDAAEVLGSSWPGDLRLVAPDGRAIGDDVVDAAHDPRIVDIRGRAWTLELGAPAASWPSSAWLTLVAGLLASVLLAGAFAVQLRRRQRAEEQVRDRSQQLERIAEAGARLQRSLDLAELLPTFAVALANDFDLRAVSVSLIDEDGELIEAFATGDRPDGISTLELPLRRGWRAVGMLTVLPGRSLDDAELTSLQALADLLAVAMSNAQLYEREQLNAARLRDLDALKNAFLGTVSHELRTSMTAIMGFGELLADSWENLDDERRREMANRIRRSAGSLRHLVDDLLDFARLEQERIRVSPRTVDLAGIVVQTVEGLAPLLGRHELELEVDGELTAWADPVAVERILANLVSNAAKYSPEGTTVTVALTHADGHARLVVSDQGPGIPPEERGRIFARFYRLDTPESVRTRGAGIGLAILADFATRSGATVTVGDAPGGGACFMVDFPRTAPIPPNTDDEMAVAR